MAFVGNEQHNFDYKLTHTDTNRHTQTQSIFRTKTRHTQEEEAAAEAKGEAEREENMKYRTDSLRCETFCGKVSEVEMEEEEKEEEAPLKSESSDTSFWGMCSILF